MSDFHCPMSTFVCYIFYTIKQESICITMKSKPIIGIPLDFEEQGSFSKRPHYALRHHYFDAIKACNALPVGLPLDTDSIEDHIDLCDGFLLPGGTYKFSDDWYQNTTQTNTKQTPNPRIKYDQTLTLELHKRKIPTLGICAGMQVMAGILGGKFYRDVSLELPTKFDHLNAKDAEEEAHSIEIFKGSFLHALLNTDKMSVNTAHREALVECPKGTELCASSPDAVIEAIAWKNHPFGLGLQWHPEFFLEDKNNPHMQIIKAFINATKEAQHA
jgi:putative glutamine amidotransferase